MTLPVMCQTLNKNVRNSTEQNLNNVDAYFVSSSKVHAETDLTRIWWLYAHFRGPLTRVVKVTDLWSFAGHRCKFEPSLGRICPCYESFQLTNGRLFVLLRCKLVNEMMLGVSLNAGSCHKTNMSSLPLDRIKSICTSAHGWL